MVSPRIEPKPSTINARRQEGTREAFNFVSSVAIVGAVLGVSSENPQDNRFLPWNKSNSDTHNIMLGFQKQCKGMYRWRFVVTLFTEFYHRI